MNSVQFKLVETLGNLSLPPDGMQQDSVQFQVMETLGNLSPMPDDVGEEQVEKMRETFLTYFMHVSRISSTWAVT